MAFGVERIDNKYHKNFKTSQIIKLSFPYNYIDVFEESISEMAVGDTQGAKINLHYYIFRLCSNSKERKHLLLVKRNVIKTATVLFAENI